ncbi:ribbon-helix-helix domain-containing protein [Aestuariivirga sp.]|uniref:ribbon-helix-helix domain-containing protein n=1 Tax=Aestuariivirga sp. TaxID=2650926 RepID=UPI00391A1857
MDRVDPLRQAADTQFRVLQRKGVKAAIRLENIFWSQLDEYAREDGVSTSQLIFRIFEEHPGGHNRTALLRCYCLDRNRRRLSSARFQAQSFDMLAMIAACPAPVAVITAERRLAAFNPSFGEIINQIRGGDGRVIQLSFSEPLTSIQRRLIDEPKRIGAYHMGIQIGDGKPRFYLSRFALADRSQGMSSLIVAFLEVSPPLGKA